MVQTSVPVFIRLACSSIRRCPALRAVIKVCGASCCIRVSITVFAVLFVLLRPSVAQEPRQAWASGPIYVGLVEDNRKELAQLGLKGTGTDPVSSRTITPAFLRDAEGWKPIQRLNERVRWTVAFDGRKLGEVESEPVPQRQGTSVEEPGPAWIHSILTDPARVPTVGKPVLGFNGNFGALVRHPLVVVSRPNFADPDQWKRAKPPVQLVGRVRTAFGDTFQHIRRCDASGEPLKSDSKLPASEILVVKAYGSNKGSFVLETQLRDHRCVFNANGSTFQLLEGNQWFYVSPSRSIVHLGRDWELVDAGDYDGHGKSEVIFYVAESENDTTVDTEGYVLFYDDFRRHTRFTWNNH